MTKEEDIVLVLEEMLEIKRSFNTIDAPRFSRTMDKARDYLHLILLNGMMPSREYTEEELEDLRTDFGNFIEPNKLASLLFESTYFRRSDLRLQMDYSKDQMSTLMDWLIKHRIIEPTSVGFRKKIPALQFLRYILLNPLPEPVYKEF